MLRNLIELVFPRTCPGCNTLLVRQEKVICFACLHDIQETEFHLSPCENELYYRLAGKTPLHGAAALWYFDKNGRLQKIINALKYHNQPQVGRRLGEYYGALLSEGTFLDGVDAWIPVPLHPKRKDSRGYNQAEQIAKGLQSHTGIPPVVGHLVRNQKTRTQTQKGKSARWESMKDAFALQKPISGNLVLVDDVITSGSTLEACIRALFNQEKPPQSIKVLAIGMTRKKGQL